MLAPCHQHAFSLVRQRTTSPIPPAVATMTTKTRCAQNATRPTAGSTLTPGAQAPSTMASRRAAPWWQPRDRPGAYASEPSTS